MIDDTQKQVLTFYWTYGITSIYFYVKHYNWLNLVLTEIVHIN